MAYWDTSCVVKLYAPEPDSAVFTAHIIGGGTIITSEITRLELWATLRRKEAVGDLRPGGARKALAAYDGDVAAGMISVETLSSAVVARFETHIDDFLSRTPPIPLRTLDAIHLSTASVCGESEMVATDVRLRDAAKALGISVFPPP